MMSLDAIYSVQKMAEVLVTGPDSEREFILFELQQLLDHCPGDTLRILLPVLCEHVPHWSTDLQAKAAARLFDVVSLDLDQPTVRLVTRAAFGVVQSGIANPDHDVANLYNLCGGILVDVLPAMHWTPPDIHHVISFVDDHSNQPLFTSRKLAARVLGALSNCFDPPRVEKSVLPRALRLFDDPDVQVRGTVVESLAFIGAALPSRVTEIEVWPRVERLLDPREDARIHATAMRTMAHILQKQREALGPPGSSAASAAAVAVAVAAGTPGSSIDGLSSVDSIAGGSAPVLPTNGGRLFRDLLPPVFAKLSAFARRHAPEDQRLVDDDTYLLLEVVSEVFGQFVFSLSMHARRSSLKDAYKAYSSMATCNGPLIRRNCAFNLPGVAKSLGERFAMELSGLCEFLAKDTDEEVRWILAAGIHQSATLLTPRGNYDRLFAAVSSLLEDENSLVRMNALENFHDLLSAFVRDNTDPANIRRLAPVFTNLSVLSEGNWRIQKRLAEQLDKCAEIIPADELVKNVLPLLFQLTEHGTPLVRHAAMNATAHALRNIPSVPDRNAAVAQYWAKASDGPFWMRLALLDGAAAALRTFSQHRFAELFAPTLYRLALDAVANVRIRFALLLPEMAPACGKQAAYSAAVSTLRNDSDSDVIKVMERHELAVAAALAQATSSASVDQARFRDEQEFYGIIPRTSKRVRGRLNNIRTPRMLSNHLRQSHDFSEPSSGHLSVSQSVISAAKATSAAASSPPRGVTPSAAAIAAAAAEPAIVPEAGSTLPATSTVTSGCGLPPSFPPPNAQHEEDEDRQVFPATAGGGAETAASAKSARAVAASDAITTAGFGKPVPIAPVVDMDHVGSSAKLLPSSSLDAMVSVSDLESPAAKMQSASLSRLPTLSGSRLASTASAAAFADEETTKSLSRLPKHNHVAVPLVHKLATRQEPASNEPRSKSWAGRLIKVQRQLSVESSGRSRTNSIDSNDSTSSGKPSRSGRQTTAARARSLMRDSANTQLPVKTGLAAPMMSSTKKRRSKQKELANPVMQGPSVTDAVRRLEEASAAAAAQTGPALISAHSSSPASSGSKASTANVLPAAAPIAAQSQSPASAATMLLSAAAPAQGSSPPQTLSARYSPVAGSRMRSGRDHTKSQQQPPINVGRMVSMSEPSAPPAAQSGRTYSVDGRSVDKSKMARDLGLRDPGPANGAVGTVAPYDDGTRLPVFQGAAPWMRSASRSQVRHPDGKKMPISALTATPSGVPAGRNTRQRSANGHAPVLQSFHSDTAHATHSKGGSRELAPSMAMSSVTDVPTSGSQAGPNTTGFLKSLFARKTRK
jgi:hypothetical protein